MTQTKTVKQTRLWAIGLMVLCTLFTSSAQILYKIGADKLSFDILSIITNWQIIIGLILYGLGAILVIIALKGGEVSTLYPIVASSYVWVSLGSVYFFKESLNTFKCSGILLIIFGIIFLNIGEKNSKMIISDKSGEAKK